MSNEQFYKDNYSKAHGLAKRLTDNSPDSEDIAQTAILKAIRGLPDFKGNSSIDTWLYRIVVNTWYNYKRSQISHEELVNQEHKQDLFSNKQEIKHLVKTALNKLDTEDRQIVSLIDLDGHDYYETSVLLSIPIGTVRSRIHRAREKLSKFL